MPGSAAFRAIGRKPNAQRSQFGLTGSPNRYRTLDLLVNSYVFETLCPENVSENARRALHVEAERAFM
jgi:hypothetical protein